MFIGLGPIRRSSTGSKCKKKEGVINHPARSGLDLALCARVFGLGAFDVTGNNGVSRLTRSEDVYPWLNTRLACPACVTLSNGPREDVRQSSGDVDSKR